MQHIGNLHLDNDKNDDGRFIDTWADEHIINELINCFAHYEKLDVLNALKSTNSLFEKVTRELDVKKSYEYPDKAAKCAKAYWEKRIGLER